MSCLSSIPVKHKPDTQIDKPLEISLHTSGKKPKPPKTVYSTSHEKLSHTNEKGGTQYNIYKYAHQVKHTEKNPDSEWAKRSVYVRACFNYYHMK